jgi:hypothetical protein
MIMLSILKKDADFRAQFLYKCGDDIVSCFDEHESSFSDFFLESTEGDEIKEIRQLLPWINLNFEDFATIFATQSSKIRFKTCRHQNSMIQLKT